MFKICQIICLFFLGYAVQSACWAQEESSSYKRAKEAFESSKYSEALELLSPVFQEAKVAYFQNPSDHNLFEDYFSALYLMGDIHWWIGNYPETEVLFREFVELALEKYGERQNNYIGRIADLAALYYDMGRYVEAEDLYVHAIELDKEVNGDLHMNLVGTLNNLAVLYDALGKYHEAENLYREVLAGYKNLLGQQHPFYATSLNNLAAFYSSMGRYTDAVPLLEESVQIHLQTSGENSRQYATALNNLGMVHFELGHLEQAKEHLTESIELRKVLVGDSHSEYLISMSNLARVYVEENQYQKAIAITGQTLTVYRELFGEMHPSYLNTLTNHAAAHLRLGRYREAEPMLLQVAENRKKIYGDRHPDYAQALSNLASVYVGLKNYGVAEKYLLESLDLFAKQIRNYFPGLSEKEQEKYYAFVKGKFEAFNSYVMCYGTQNAELVSRMYDNLLFTKALLLETNRKSRERVLQSNDPGMNDLFLSWQHLRESYSQYISQGINDEGEYHSVLDSLDNKINEKEKEMSMNSSLILSSQFPTTGWEKIREKLSEKEAAIEIVRFRKYDLDFGGKFTDSIEYAALILTQQRDFPEVVWLENGNQLEDRLFRAYRRDIEQDRTESNAYRNFWEPISSKIPYINRIFLSPDGVYHKINPATLLLEGSEQYLLDQNEIILLSSTREILSVPLLSEGKNLTQAVLMGSPEFGVNLMDKPKGFGSESDASNMRGDSGPGLRTFPDLNPLPGAKVEVEAIATLLGELGVEADTYLGSNASEVNLKKVNRPDILHISTHGFFKDFRKPYMTGQHPLFGSGLYLSRPSEPELLVKNPAAEKFFEDGIFTAYEAISLDLEGTELVALSACETALGTVRNGEGVDGLQRAFQLAGARSILMSLWKVDDDAAREFMTAFYREWLSGKDKQSAFRLAQIQTREYRPDPFFWGAFVLVGQ